ncbi:MAG: S-layer homology domain-containing protein, partial [Chloroflexi bacterium]|nr:S-layer homology domain-containing protein [Chloroflexota bacterium]
SWSALGSNGAGDGALNAGVVALAVNGLNVYAGGGFTNVNNGGTVLNAADFIAKWDGSNWSSLGNGTDGSITSTVRAIAVSGSDVCVGGSFANVNNGGIMLFAADHIAKWNGSTWSALGSNGAGNGSIGGNNDIVYALFVNGADLLVGGGFSNVNNNGTMVKEADYLAAYGIGADVTPPTVASITRAGANPTSAASVDFTVAFSESVTGIDAGDFTLTTGGVSDAAVSGVSGSGSIYTVTVSTGTGIGTLRLDVPDTAVITDVKGNPLSGLPYTGGAIYNIRTNTFNDVPINYWAWQFIERLSSAGITSGCGNSNYCPTTSVTRAQMAIFLLRGIHGSGYTPPAATGTVFNDVPANAFAAAWIEQLATEGITSGCGNNNFCPNSPVSRASMAVFLVRAKHGIAFVPPTATGIFADVPVGSFGANYIEQLVADGITSGCGPGSFCPSTTVTRDQMAVFLVRTFNLP